MRLVPSFDRKQYERVEWITLQGRQTDAIVRLRSLAWLFHSSSDIFSSKYQLQLFAGSQFFVARVSGLSFPLCVSFFD